MTGPGSVLASSQAFFQAKKNILTKKGTATALETLRKYVAPSLEKIGKASRILGVAGIVLNGTALGYDILAGEQITAGRLVDTTIGIVLSLAAITNPIFLVGLGIYAIADAYGVLDDIKSSLGGDTVIINGN